MVFVFAIKLISFICAPCDMHFFEGEKLDCEYFLGCYPPDEDERSYNNDQLAYVEISQNGPEMVEGEKR